MVFFRGPAARRSDSLESQFEWGIDENHGIADFLPAGFEQQGGIEDSGSGVRGNIFELFEDFAADTGPDDVVEVFAGGLLFRGVTEDECCEFGAVDFAGWIGNLRTEVLQEQLADGRGEQLLVADVVGVNQEQPSIW